MNIHDSFNSSKPVSRVDDRDEIRQSEVQTEDVVAVSENFLRFTVGVQDPTHI